MALNKIEKRERLKHRIKKSLKTTTKQHRLSVYKSNSEIYAQIVLDAEGKTIIAAGTNDKSLKSAKGTKTEKAKLVGKLIAERAVAAGISEIVFDRNGFIYHGRIKALADAARENGLKF
ncbi:MAG: 50S ribosomal protein L18 [Sphingobacteriaceae bacterium]|nr:50S ribosomal protein L18 [Sphingobacteriaceae bacterium]